jgi:hypothetical protein
LAKKQQQPRKATSMSASRRKQSKADNAAIDKFGETLLQSADANNKVKINEVKFPSFYLPSIGNVSELLGFFSTQKQWVDLLEEAYEIPLEISRSSKYDFFSKGVGPRTANKFINWFKKLPLPIGRLANKKLMAKIIRSQKAGSNAGNWFSYIQSFEAGFENSGNTEEHEFMPLFEFLEHRCNTEVDFSSNLKQEIKAGRLKRTDLAAQWKAQQLLWANSPCLSPHVIENMAQILILHSQQKSLTEQQNLSLIESYCYLSFDFYLEAISHYEVGCRFCYGNNQAKLENELGMITKAIYAYATDDNIQTCFDGMLTQLKEVTSELVEDETSYRKLASFIEIEENGSIISGEALEDKKYNQLKGWRKGLNLPSGKKLITFLQNLDEYADTSSGFITFLMCRITMGMDKLIYEVLAQSKGDNCNPADVLVIIKKVLATMPEYYKAILRKQLDKREPTT